MKSKALFLGSPAAKVGTPSRNLLVLYNADCKDKGNTLIKAIFTENKSVVVLKMLLFECAWAPSLVHPHIIKLFYPWRHMCDEMYHALPLLCGESLRTRLWKVHKHCPDIHPQCIRVPLPFGRNMQFKNEFHLQNLIHVCQGGGLLAGTRVQLRCHFLGLNQPPIFYSDIYDCCLL